MSYVAAEARQEMLRDIAEAIDEIGKALGRLGAAYELLDERAADVLEEQLFRPAQITFGRAQRAHAGFAQRFSLNGRAFAPGTAGAASATAQDLIGASVEAIEEADHLLADLQDSLRPVEVGDAQLRADLAEVRTLLGPLPGRARQLQRLLGR